MMNAHIYACTHIYIYRNICRYTHIYALCLNSYIYIYIYICRCAHHINQNVFEIIQYSMGRFSLGRRGGETISGVKTGGGLGGEEGKESGGPTYGLAEYRESCSQTVLFVVVLCFVVLF